MKTKHIKYIGHTISVSSKIAKVIKTTDRKMRYQEKDLKSEIVEIDYEAETVTVIPSKKDSYDRLLAERHMEFASEEKSVEDFVDFRIKQEMLLELLHRLEPLERKVIHLRYWEGFSEEVTGKILGRHQSTIHRWEKKILRKLSRWIEDS